MRFAVPDKSIEWYSLKHLDDLSPLELVRNDAEAFPVMFFEETKAQFSQGSLDKAQRLAEAGLGVEMYRKNSFNRSLNFLLALIYMREGDKEKEERQLQEILRLFPEDSDAHLSLSKFYLTQGADYQRALDYGKKAIALDPDHSGAQVAVGDILTQMGQPDKAVGYYQKAAMLGDRNPGIYARLGYLYPRSNESEKTDFNLATLYANRKQYDKAIPLFERAIQLEPDAYDTYENLSRVYYQLGQYSKASQYFRTSLTNRIHRRG